MSAERRVRFWVALGVAGRQRAPQLVLLRTLGIALLMLVALATSGVFSAVQSQSDRLAAITPAVGASADEAEGRLVTIDPQLKPQRRWNGHDVQRSYYRGATEGIMVPGVPRVPGEGEYFASPALAQLIEDDPVVAAQFAGKTQVGLVARTSLVHPGELRAVVGMDDNTLLASEVIGFGDPSVSEASQLNTLVALLVLTVVWLPSLGLLVMVTRLSARSHQRTARALHLLGLSRSQVRFVEAGVTAPTALAGVLTGVVVFWGLTRLEHIPGTPFGFFAADARPAPWMIVLVAVGVVALACLVSAGSVSFSGSRTARTVPVPRLSARVGAVALVAGSVTLIVTPILRDLLGTSAHFLLWVACAGVAAGLGLCGPMLVSRAADAMAERSWTASRSVGLRMAAAGGSHAVRLASVLCVLVVSLLGARAFLFVLEGGSNRAWNEQTTTQPRVPASATDLRGGITLAEVRQVLGASVPVLQVRDHELPGEPLRVVYGTCQDVRRISGEELHTCPSRPVWLEVQGPLPERPSGAAEVDGHRLLLPQQTDSLRVNNLPAELAGALLVPTGAEPTTRSKDGSIFLMLPTGAEVNWAIAAVSSLDPVVQVDLGDADRGNPDVQQYPTQAAWIVLAAIVALAIGAVALVVGATGERAERAVRYRGLTLLGAPRAVVLKVHLWAVVAPLVGLVVMATGIGTLVSSAMRGLDDRAAIPTTLALSCLLGGVVAVAVVGLVTRPSRSGSVTEHPAQF